MWEETIRLAEEVVAHVSGQRKEPFFPRGLPG